MKKNRKRLASIVLGASVLAVGGARAASGHVGARIVNPLTMTESLSLEFGQLSSSTEAGAVVVDAAGGRTAEGGSSLEGGIARSGAWSVSGEASTAYTITLPVSAALSSDDNSMTIDTFIDNKGGNSTTDPTGADTFKVGATLSVGADQPTGTYTGSYTVTIAYQ